VTLGCVNMVSAELPLSESRSSSINVRFEFLLVGSARRSLTYRRRCTTSELTYEIAVVGSLAVYADYD